MTALMAFSREAGGQQKVAATFDTVMQHLFPETDPSTARASSSHDTPSLATPRTPVTARGKRRRNTDICETNTPLSRLAAILEEESETATSEEQTEEAARCRSRQKARINYSQLSGKRNRRSDQVG